jgi:hypothetical protein
MKDEDTNSKNLENGEDMLISREILSLKDGINNLKMIDEALASVKVVDLRLVLVLFR